MNDRIGSMGETSNVYNGITVNTPFEDKDSTSVKVEDFLQLMVAQLSNQDFLNPVDDTQYVSQLAQFATMTAMQEMNQYSQTSYVASLVGKTVTVAALGLGANVTKDVGVVTSVSLSGDAYTITVNGKQYELSQIMSISDTAAAAEEPADVDEAANMALYRTEVTGESISIRWQAPVTNAEAAAGLRYDVYITGDEALGQNFDTVEGVKKGELKASGQEALSYTFDGLEGGKTYYINVVVRDAAGHEAVYQYSTAATKIE